MVENSFLSPNQHGFRDGFSADTALCDIRECVVKGCDSGHYVCGLFLDLAKAFDCLDHPILIDHLATLGFDESACSWFSSSLSDRSLVVTAEDKISDSFLVSHGIPQGSVLRPVLFLVYFDLVLRFGNSFHPLSAS